MKKGSLILLSCVVCASLVSCKKENSDLQPDGQETERMVQVRIEFTGNEGVCNTREAKSAIYDNFQLGAADNPFGTITLWAYLSGSEKAENCISFNPNEPLPSLWLREGREYSFVAVSNVDLSGVPDGDHTLLGEEEIFSYYAQAHKTPVGKKLPLFAKGNIPQTTDGSTIAINFSHSWAQILFRIDDTALNGGYRPTSFNLYKKENGEIVEYDRAAAMELLFKGTTVKLYCPADNEAWNGDEDLLPYVEITGDLTGAFAGTVTYRIRIGREKEIFAANQYSYTFKPTLEHLINISTPKWDTDADIYLADFSKVEVTANLNHNTYNSMYDEYYPAAWQDLPSNGASNFLIGLCDKGQGIIIPVKWYTTEISGNPVYGIYTANNKRCYLTRSLGNTLFTFSAPNATNTLEYTLATIWQPTISSKTAIPVCPDVNLAGATMKFGTELTEMTYSGMIKAQSGNSIRSFTFTADVTPYYKEDSLLDNCMAYSVIQVQGRTENPRIPIVQDKGIIIYNIEKETANASWGSAYNISIGSRTYKYTLPSNYPAYQEFVYPYIAFLDVHTTNSNLDIYVNGRLFH